MIIRQCPQLAKCFKHKQQRQRAWAYGAGIYVHSTGPSTSFPQRRTYGLLWLSEIAEHRISNRYLNVNNNTKLGQSHRTSMHSILYQIYHQLRFIFFVLSSIRRLKRGKSYGKLLSGIGPMGTTNISAHKSLTNTSWTNLTSVLTNTS